MRLPLDVFEAYEHDAIHILRLEHGLGESPEEKFNRMARDRLAVGPRNDWWCE
jgi:hypothetical protein